jgi:hypothetical protein
MLTLALLVAVAVNPDKPVSVPAGAPDITVVRQDADKRVDVLFDGQPFASLRFTDDVKKPVLFPVRTARGTIITRGWPLEPRPDEATDHKHHVGYWLNYGDVNGVDFWGNSGGGGNKGSVQLRAVQTARGGKGRGDVAIAADWVKPDGSVVLREATTFTFSGGRDRRVVDRATTLTAASGPVAMPDNKEGMLGLRVARALEHPGDKNPSGTGRYRSSEGIEGEAVWGTRGRWLMLTGTLDGGEPVTIAIFDHPKNVGFPTYWHARPWGLFAANPLGQKVFSKGKQVLGYAIPAKGTTRFQYRLLILSRHAKPDEVEAEYQRWARGPLYVR